MATAHYDEALDEMGLSRADRTEKRVIRAPTLGGDLDEHVAAVVLSGHNSSYHR